MNWILLLIAGVFEVIWAVGLKYTNGFTKLWPSVGVVIAMIISVVLLAYAMRELPVGTAYAIWVGVGAIGTAVVGMMLLGDPISTGRIVSLVLVASGIIGLKLSAF